jgi:hypothetical protein
VPQVLERLVLQVRLLHLYETAMDRAGVQTNKRVGRRELVREWRAETDWEMKKLKQSKHAPGQNGIASGNEYPARV